MNKVYMVWLKCDDIEPLVIAVCTSKEKAQKAIDLSVQALELDNPDCYTIDEVPIDTVTLNDIPYTI